MCVSKDYSEYLAEAYAAQQKIDEENERAQKKQVRPTWGEMFMRIALVVSERSKDPKTKVGAVIVKGNHLLGIGYNADPKGFSYSFDWTSPEKYDYVIHAEMNAIANATASGADIRGSDIYVTLSPCNECMKLLIQYEIKHVYYLYDYEKTIEKTKLLAQYSDIKLMKMRI